MNTEEPTCWGVYRVLESGVHKYITRTATTNQRLAMEIANDLSAGIVVRPDGSTLHIPAYPHIAKPIDL